MVTIETTPDMAAKVYETIEQTLEVVRRRLNRPLTLADKVLLGHLDDPENQEMIPGESYLNVRPDRVILQDVLGQTGMLQFMQTQRESVAVPTTIHCDHLIQARVEGAADLRESLAENSEVYNFLRSAAAKFGAGFWGPGGRHHPPGRAGKLRLPWLVDDRHGLAHAERGWTWVLLCRRWRR